LPVKGLVILPIKLTYDKMGGLGIDLEASRREGGWEGEETTT